MLGRKFLFQSSIVIFVLFTIATVVVPTARAANGGAGEFISRVGQEAISTLTSKKMSDEEREDRFREILNRTFRLKQIARFTLGRYWRRATENQKKEYVGLFEDFIVQAYTARFKAYSGETFNVGKVRDINDRDKIVQSALILTDGRKIPVHWRVRRGGDYKIIDVLVEGVSMAITQRDEFASIINQQGGKVEGLLVALRRKTGRK